MHNEQAPQSFSLRAFTSMVVVFSFTVLSLSGLIMLLWPGRSTPSVLGLSRHAWSGMHEWISVLVVIAAGVHLWYNWRPVLSYLRRGAGVIRREWVVAFALVAMVTAGAFVGGGKQGPGGPPGAAGRPAASLGSGPSAPAAPGSQR